MACTCMYSGAAARPRYRNRHALACRPLRKTAVPLPGLAGGFHAGLRATEPACFTPPGPALPRLLPVPRRVIESVATSLEGQRLASFTRVSTAVQQAVEEALTRILTPKRSIDVLREVKAAQVGRRASHQAGGRQRCLNACRPHKHAAMGACWCALSLPPTRAARLQAKGRPYTIVFVGVNGVGKSTNLAKVGHGEEPIRAELTWHSICLWISCAARVEETSLPSPSRVVCIHQPSHPLLLPPDVRICSGTPVAPAAGGLLAAAERHQGHDCCLRHLPLRRRGAAQDALRAPSGGAPAPCASPPAAGTSGTAACTRHRVRNGGNAVAGTLHATRHRSPVWPAGCCRHLPATPGCHA